MKRQILTAGLSVLLPGLTFAAGDTLGIPDKINLTAAISLVEEFHPSISAAKAEIEATAAEALQGGLLPNPVFSAEAENIAGSGDYSGTDSAEYTLFISQTIQPGNKRAKRRKASHLQSTVAEKSLLQRRQQLALITIRAFYDALEAETRLELALRQTEVARKLVAKAKERVTSGRANKLEVSRAALALADSELAVTNFRLSATRAKAALAALWGGHAEDIHTLESPWPEPPPPPELKNMEEFISRHPAVVQAEAARLQSIAAADAEEAAKYPDIDVGIGARRFDESGDSALVVGISIPLTFSDRNQGNRRAAKLRIEQAQDNIQAVRLAVYRRLLAKQSEVLAAYNTVKSLQTKQMPVAADAFEQASSGYSKGLFSSLDLLDAMRTLFYHEARYATARIEYLRARDELNNMLNNNNNR